MSHSPDQSDQPRRSFMVQAAAAGTGAIAGVVPACIGAAYFLDPLLRSKATADSSTPVGEMGEGFLPITKLESLPSDGTPRAFKVIADLQDAWNKFPQTEIGSVYLSRSESGEISCFNAPLSAPGMHGAVQGRGPEIRLPVP
jgi:menaquinol-cytochrome c reductase iron-sulfur subunit